MQAVLTQRRLLAALASLSLLLFFGCFLSVLEWGEGFVSVVRGCASNDSAISMVCHKSTLTAAIIPRRISMSADFYREDYQKAIVVRDGSHRVWIHYIQA
jgi:hypothetical protein